MTLRECPERYMIQLVKAKNWVFVRGKWGVKIRRIENLFD
jgi:hypothetical protein